MANIKACATGLLVIIGLQLAGCATKSSANPTNPSAAEGELTGGLTVNYTAKQKALLQRMQGRKIQALEVGEQIMLILPADKFYLPCSPAIQREAYPALNDIAQLLRTYPKTSVTITGYTDNLGSGQRNVALSRQRAQTIADYLWSQDMDARLVYTEGKGAIGALADNSYAQGRWWNRRIEINFQRLPS